MQIPQSDGPSIGQRLEFRRRRRGLSRKVVANLAGRSEEWLRLVESGQRKLDSLEILFRISEILQIEDFTELVDWPDRPTARPNPGPQEGLRELREVVIDHPALRIRSKHPTAGQDTAVLATDLRDCRTTWTTSPDRYSQLIRRLPGIIEAARTARWQRQDAETADWLVDAYHLARHLFTACGDHDMAATVADRAMETSAQVHHPQLIAASAWHVAMALLHSRYPVEARDYALAASHRLAETDASGDAELLVAALRLLAAHAAAIATDTKGATSLLAEARAKASGIDRDRNVRGIAFGPAEVGITSIEIALAQHDPDQVIRMAPTIPMFEDLAYERRVTYLICQACAFVLRREDAEATLVLMKIAELSPEAIRFDSDAHHCIQQLLRRENYFIRAEVNSLAQLADIT
ncbi:helix-turn-helix domain-containing protein [Nocardia brasiliensis]|uniref:helix-turn-helix domain-containing protein n=1 Tax=Nocardia brasiliensis TaxID=37326 RepID=UPI00245752AF|nr:helix-turn-helix domain-containing protein [Nocardia brasiliensis]